ncbi:hypothetical protein D9757_006961 [Collybiopsis confluens]|uniref:Uncharacterized protein n=1 Tax=Collybiopsis confluens TaxID=2823264 RepID=A0A8H5M7S8_9AGAR|nr:hypothetical protein D9757_006961 [Collybiopsis confluens]
MLLKYCLLQVSFSFLSWFLPAAYSVSGRTASLPSFQGGFSSFAAGLYVNNRFGNKWLVLLGAALCGISAGVFGHPKLRLLPPTPNLGIGKGTLGYWLTYRLSGQILGGAINLGLNAQANEAGKVSYTVYLVFIAIYVSGPFVAPLLNKPDKVKRQDGKKISITIHDRPWAEMKATTRAFFNPKFLLIVLWIGQGVFSEAVFFTYLALYFTVRARALGSFLSGVCTAITGNLLGNWLDRVKFSLKLRARTSFWAITTCQGGWWIWALILATRFRETKPKTGLLLALEVHLGCISS